MDVGLVYLKLSTWRGRKGEINGCVSLAFPPSLFPRDICRETHDTNSWPTLVAVSGTKGQTRGVGRKLVLLWQQPAPLPREWSCTASSEHPEVSNYSGICTCSVQRVRILLKSAVLFGKPAGKALT